jgi:hypothetical protein
VQPDSPTDVDGPGLTGSGAYAGLTYFILATGYPPNKIQGQIYPGTPPKP